LYGGLAGMGKHADEPLVKLYKSLSNVEGQQKKYNHDLNATAANQAMVKRGTKASTEELEQQIGALSRVSKAGKDIAIHIATTYDDPKDATKVGKAAQEALAAGVPAKKVKGLSITAKGDPASARKAVADLVAATKEATAQKVAIKAKADLASAKAAGSAARKEMEKTPASIKVLAGSAIDSSPLDTWAKNKTVNIKAVITKAEGGSYASGGVQYSTRNKRGTTAAASGYMIETANRNASNRPKHSAMGKFREPTLLVGEENQTEYVIATNPAYRAANKQYLAQAAQAMGMSVWDGVVPAFRGLSSSQESKAIFTGADATRNVKGAKKALHDFDVKYKAETDAKKKAKMHKQRPLKVAKLHDAEKGGAIRAEYNDIEILTERASNMEKLMANAEKRGNAGAYASAKSKRATYLNGLRKRYAFARGGSGALNKAKLDGMIADIDGQLLDLGTSSSSQSATQARNDQLSAQLLSAQNSAAINAAFAETAGGMLSGVVASGGPGGAAMFGGGRGGMMSRHAGTSITINTLHPGDPNTLLAIGKAATAGHELQGSVSSPRSVVG